MGYNRVEHLGCLFLLQVVIGKSLFQSTTDKTIFGISQSRLTIFIHRLLNATGCFIPLLFYFHSIGQSMNKTFYFRIILQ